MYMENRIYKSHLKCFISLNQDGGRVIQTPINQTADWTHCPSKTFVVAVTPAPKKGGSGEIPQHKMHECRNSEKSLSAHMRGQILRNRTSRHTMKNNQPYCVNVSVITTIINE